MRRLRWPLTLLVASSATLVVGLAGIRAAVAAPRSGTAASLAAKHHGRVIPQGSHRTHHARLGISTTVREANTGLAWTGSETTGTAAIDTATLEGAEGVTPTGTVTYVLFDDGTCTGSAAMTVTVNVAGGSVPGSLPSDGLAAGDHSYLASYSGDTNYTPVTAACELFAVMPAP